MRALLLLAAVLPLVCCQSLGSLPLNLVELPPGFSIALYTTTAIPAARQLALSKGFNSDYPDAIIVYVGSTSAGTVRLAYELIAV